MTRKKKLKRRVRERMEATGETYTAARRELGRASNGLISVRVPLPLSLAQDDILPDDTVRAIQSICDRLLVRADLLFAAVFGCGADARSIASSDDGHSAGQVLRWFYERHGTPLAIPRSAGALTLIARFDSRRTSREAARREVGIAAREIHRLFAHAVLPPPAPSGRGGLPAEVAMFAPWTWKPPRS